MDCAGGKSKELVRKADFACHTGRRQHEMATPDHAHDLKALIVAEAVFILWKPQVGRITRLSAP